MTHKRILVVEDNENNLQLFRIILNKPDWDLIYARDGQEALEKIELEEPDLIILDIQIPKITGLELARRIREDPTKKEITIVAVTAYAMKGDEEKIMKAGCDAYVAKPIDTRSFPQKIAQLLDSCEPGIFGDINNHADLGT